MRADPTQPNLRQVHLIHEELLDELASKGYDVGPGALGENILTRGLDLLALPRGTVLKCGDAEVVVTGLRNPCKQLNDYQAGLMNAVLDRDADGGLIRKAGVMGIVQHGGVIEPGAEIEVLYPPTPHERLEPV